LSLDAYFYNGSSIIFSYYRHFIACYRVMFALAVGITGGELAGRWAGWGGFTGCC